MVETLIIIYVAVGVAWWTIDFTRNDEPLIALGRALIWPFMALMDFLYPWDR